VLPTEPIADALRRQGYSENPVARFDTRHELDMPLSAGPVMFTPFVAVRGTAWSDRFEQFSRTKEDSTRLWGATGVTASTEIQRVYNGVGSRLFDVNRLRHIIQPSVTVWTAGTSRDQDTLPVYDQEVEALQAGSALRLAVNQIFQTQRGGPGRWRSVDWITWDTELVTPSGDTAKNAGIGRWYDARPEYSILGDTFVRSDATWQLSEILGIGGGVVFDYGTSQIARANVGLTLQHAPVFSSYAELRSVGALDSTFVNFGAAYRLTQQYFVSASASYDTKASEIQTVTTEIQRSYPNVVLGVGVSYNNITNVTSFGFTLKPVGVGGSGGARVSGFGAGPGRVN
jgi:hypothetical protein